MTCLCCYRPLDVCEAERARRDTESETERLQYIAGQACALLAELSGLYDDTGREAEAIMCDWKPGSAGECAAKRVVEYLKSVRG